MVRRHVGVNVADLRDSRIQSKHNAHILERPVQSTGLPRHSIGGGIFII